MDTDTFTRGQWLKHKSMKGTTASISPNGVYFGYSYSVYSPSFHSHGVISRLPNFTAIYFNENFSGWEDEDVSFNRDGTARIEHNPNWVKRFDEPGLVKGASAEFAAEKEARVALCAARASKSKSKAAVVHLRACEAAMELARAAIEAVRAPSGFIDTDTWTDSRGRRVCVEGARIRVGDVVVLDTTEDAFIEVKSEYAFERVG